MEDDRRQNPRTDCGQAAKLTLQIEEGAPEEFDITVIDISSVGAGIVVEDEAKAERIAAIPPSCRGKLQIAIAERRRDVECKVMWADPTGRQIGLWFSEDSAALAQDPLFHQFVGTEYL